MLKQAIAVLLLAPAISWAECGFVSNGTEMTIVVSKKSNNKCFDSEQFRAAFRANLTASVKAMGDRAPEQVTTRRAAQRPPAMAMPVQQAELYYGQATKR